MTQYKGDYPFPVAWPKTKKYAHVTFNGGVEKQFPAMRWYFQYGHCVSWRLICPPFIRMILEAAYGRKDGELEAKVKAIYEDLQIAQVYKKYEEKAVKEVRDRIATVDESEGLKKGVFEAFLSKTSGKTKKNLSERAKNQFEADSEDEAMEDEIEQNLDLLSGAAGRLNGLARATGDELDKHNKHLERIIGKLGRNIQYSQLIIV
ncbi:hypothetical protein V8E54_012141 [Elaphomyces granulatus]